MVIIPREFLLFQVGIGMISEVVFLEDVSVQPGVGLLEALANHLLVNSRVRIQLIIRST